MYSHKLINNKIEFVLDVEFYYQSHRTQRIIKKQIKKVRKKLDRHRNKMLCNQGIDDYYKDNYLIMEVFDDVDQYVSGYSFVLDPDHFIKYEYYTHDYNYEDLYEQYEDWC